MDFYAKDCELVLGLVAPVGVNLGDVQNRLESIFRQFRYDVDFVHLSEVSKSVFGNDGPPLQDEVSRLDAAMKQGTEAREKYKRGDIYALLAIDAISSKRDSENDRPKPVKRKVHVIRSLKHAEEVETLRQVYGRGFFLLGVSASINTRRNYLENIKGVKGHQLEKIIKKDDKEGVPLGQQTRSVFQLADAFVTTDDTERLSSQLSRIIDLLFSKPVEPPTAEEYAMFMSYAASLRSADLSRQVGAVVMNSHKDILSTGANDVPRMDGGLYWPGKDDQRDYVKGFDSNEREKEKIIDDVLQSLFPDGCDDSELLRGKLKGSRLMDLTEFGRAVHAEMESLLQAARNGVSVRGCSLYTTTYPCHNCAKHIIAAGIKEVVYIEPYPKSYAKQLHDDCMESEEAESEDKVVFRQFVGVGPRRFVDLFSTRLSSGRKVTRKVDGGLQVWDRNDAELRVPMTPLSYLESEMKLVKEFSELTRS